VLDMSNENPEVIVMCGLPRSGKSTWTDIHKHKHVVINRDAIRKNIFGHQFFAPAESFVRAIAESMVQILLMQDKSVIIDETCITRKKRDVWRRLASSSNAKFKIVYINTAHCVVYSRNKSSLPGEKLPEDVIQGMIKNFEEPEGWECDELIIVSNP